jgi:hypothetical protein
MSILHRQEVPMKKPARLYYCALCHCQVSICSDCDRGNIYCNQGCAEKSRQITLREAGKRYQQSYRGKQKHAARQKRYRIRLQQQTKKVTHQGSKKIAVAACLSEPAKTVKSEEITRRPAAHCHFCGECIPEFLRTDYLRHGAYEMSKFAKLPKLLQ